MNKYLLNFKYAFRPRKPLLVLRLAVTFLRILLLRAKPLRYMDTAIGYRCNLRCQHCFATALQMDTRRRMTPMEYKKIVRQAMRLGAVNFSFQGGEPTLYPELLEFVRQSVPEQNLISVTTNATCLNRKRILELKRAGVDILTISLDSARAEEHDAFRGIPGTFDKVMHTIVKAQECGLNITLGAVVSHQNIRSQGLLELIELAHRLRVVLFLALAVPVGKWAQSRQITLTLEDRFHLDSLVKKYPLLRTDFEANYVHRGCGAVKEILYLTPYGDVLACPFIHATLGNVFDTSLAKIRKHALANPDFADYAPLCLAAEDPEFMARNNGPFYDGKGKPKPLRLKGSNPGEVP